MEPGIQASAIVWWVRSFDAAGPGLNNIDPPQIVGMKK
jgi:hypothetical protein